MSDEASGTGTNRPNLNRRRFLEMLGAAGGTGVVLQAMEAWGMGISADRSSPPDLSRDPNGKRVVILGAGLSGMAAAHELGKWGYETPILEARDFAGGRCQTIRSGSVRTEADGVTQRCDFDDGHYLNNGPWRIPHTHEATLHYARELDVPLELFVNQNDRGWAVMQDTEGPLSGKRVRLGHAKADMRGYVAEILAKSIHQGKLDDELSADDRERLVEYLRREGYLEDPDLAYRGSPRVRGWKTEPGFEEGVPGDPYGFLPLLRSGLGNAFRSVEMDSLMFQPVGGMDRLALGFERAVGHRIRYGTEVREIRQDEDGVRIGWRDTSTGETGEVRADYCLCTLPLSVLAHIPSDFSSRFHQAIRTVSYQPVGKMGLQFRRRFWEEDDGIFGGHSVGDGAIRRISYPSFNWQGQKGVIQGYYSIGPDCIPQSALPPGERIEWALEHGSVYHPDSYREEFETGFSFFWHKSKWNRGAWASWTEEGLREHYPVLASPEGRVYLAGDHISHLTSWMQGAIESAWGQIEKLHERAQKEAAE